jgi:hypothetical protein
MIKNLLKPIFIVGLPMLMFVYCSEPKTQEPENINAQNTELPDSTHLTFAEYLPIDDTLIVIDSIAGFLNDDDFKDYILVCKSQNESDTEYDEYDRKSYIYVGQQNGIYKLHSSNVGSVLCKNCGGVFGDPYDGFTIDPKIGFSITHYGGSNFRWGILSKFVYDKSIDNWVLTSVENTNFSTNEPDKVDTELFTNEQFGTVYFQDFKVDSYR